jgi:hypothetical protein
MLPAGIVQPIDLLTALDTLQRCLIVGVTGTGKTSLLRHLLARRLQISKVVVFDPHAYPGKWPGCIVIGRGRNYSEIDRALTGLLQLMDKRYDDIGQGLVAEGNHPPLTILIDEWRAIAYNLKGASDVIKALLTESRKAAFSIFVVSQSDRAKPLGLEGEYDLKDGFAIVRLTVAGGKHRATLDTGNGEQATILPGPFVASPSRVFEPIEPIDLTPKPDATEARILELYRQGESISAIAAAVYGSKGGNQNEQVKNILTRFNWGRV